MSSDFKGKTIIIFDEAKTNPEIWWFKFYLQIAREARAEKNGPAQSIVKSIPYVTVK